MARCLRRACQHGELTASIEFAFVPRALGKRDTVSPFLGHRFYSAFSAFSPWWRFLDLNIPDSAIWSVYTGVICHQGFGKSNMTSPNLVSPSLQPAASDFSDSLFPSSIFSMLQF